MSGFLLRILINALVLVMVVVKLPGVFVDTLGGILLGAVIIGLVNAAIPFLLTMLQHPGVSLGRFTIAVNCFTPLAVVSALPGYRISGLLASVAGVALMTATSYMCSRIIRDR